MSPVSEIYKRIVQNILWLLFGTVANKLFVVAYYVALTRSLGVESFGSYATAMSVVMLTSIIMDMGTNLYIVKEIPRNKEKVVHYVLNAALLRSVLSAVFLMCLYLYAIVQGMDSSKKDVLLMLGIWMVINGQRQLLRAAFKGVERMRYDTYIEVSYNALMFLFAIVAAILIGGSVLAIVQGITIGAAVSLLISIHFFRKHIGWARITIDFTLWKRCLSQGAGLMAASTIIASFIRFDTILLSRIASEGAAGVYNIASQLIVNLQTIPVMITLAVFPKLSEWAYGSSAEFGRLLGNILKTLGGIGIIIASFLVFFAPLIVIVLFGEEFSESVPVLRILAVTYFLNSLIYLEVFALNAKGKQFHAALIGTIALMINCALDAYLIPEMAYIGPAFASIISKLFMFTVLTAYLINARYLSVKDLRLKSEDWQRLKMALLSIFTSKIADQQAKQ